MDIETTKRVPSSSNRPGLTLTWTDLSIWVKRKSEETFFWKQKYEKFQILNNVSGIAKSGSLLAIMGASGSGKTTLLATISQRIKGEISGIVKINGKNVNQELIAKMSGFVPQQDLAVDSLSVKEHMEFMAFLKTDRRMRECQRTRLINTLLSDLGLTKCEDKRLSVLSSGERKRLSLAVQLLTDPPLLFCDEPTTGLDSYSASVVVETLQHVASSGRVVVCSIHQPASGIFDMFTHVLLLAEGRLAFYGDISGATKFFESIGMICPPTYNKAEFFVKQLAVTPGKEEESKQRILNLCDKFKTSSYGQELTEYLYLMTMRNNDSLSHSDYTRNEYQRKNVFGDVDENTAYIHPIHIHDNCPQSFYRVDCSVNFVLEAQGRLCQCQISRGVHYTHSSA